MNTISTSRVEITKESGGRKSRTFTRWFGKHTVSVAWVALSLAILLPPKGIGLSLCWMRGKLEIPCPGCGLTRSFSCAVRGHFYESWLFHPFGPFLLAMFFVVAVVSLLPETRRAGLAAVMEQHERLLRFVFLLLVTAFCSYGLLRALLQLSGFCQFNA